MKKRRKGEAEFDLEEAKKFFDFVGTMLIALDKRGYVVHANKRALNILGCSYSKIVGKNWFDNFVPERDRRDVKRVFKGLIAGRIKLFQGYENNVLTANGERTIVWRNTVLRDKSGRITGTLSSGVDITERKRVEELLQESREKYYTLVEKGNNGVVVVQDGCLKFTNSKILEMTGYSKAEVALERNFLNFIAPEFRPLMKERYKQRISGKRIPLRYESGILAKDGRAIPVEVSGSLIEYEGRPADMVVISDITERKKAERLAHIQSEIIRNLSEGVFLIRVKDDLIAYANPRFEKMFGYEPGELVGKHVWALNAPSDKRPEDVSKEIKSAVMRNGFWQGDVRNVKKDGTVFLCHAKVSAFEHPEYGKVWVSVHTDITDLQKAKNELLTRNLELERAYEELKYLSLVKEEFVSTISHALKTPLTSIMSFISLFRTGKLGPVTDMQKEGVKAIQSESNRLFMLVNNILDASKVETSNFILYRDREDLNLLVRSCMKRLANSAKDRGNVMSLHSPKPLYVSFDRSWMDKVLDNIISNSIKFTRNGTIKINLYKVKGSIKFSLTDTGRGMTKEELSKVFEKFYQGQKQAGTGTGLGLYISKKVIDAHGGKIRVESPGPGKGSTIWFTLPN